jgi:hypothetical protein
VISAATSDAIDGVIWASTVLVLIFVVQYTLSAPWWRDPVGRTVVAKDICLLFLLIPACILLVWPHAFTPMEVAVIDLISLGGVAVVMVWRCVVWFKINPPWPFPHKSGEPRTHLPRWLPRR